MKHVLAILLLFVTCAGAQIVTPISNGKLTTALDGNSQNINKLSGVVVGTGTGTSVLHLFPSGSPTTAAEGIKIGSDIQFYRSAAATMTLTGDLVVSGSITGGGTPVTLAGNNTWTGSNTFNNTVTLGATTVVGTSGLSFSGSGAANTRLALALRPGVEVQAFHASLAALAGATTTDGNFLVGNGSTWVVESGATARASLGLGTSDSPTFTGLTLSGTGTAATLNVTTALSVPNAIDSGSAVTIGGTLIFGSGDVLTANGGLTVLGDTILGDNTSDTTKVYGTLLFGAAGDTNLYRDSASVLKTDDTFVAAALQPAAPLGVTYGGTGLNTSALAADRFLYTTSIGVFTSAPVTSVSRTLLATTTEALWRTALGLGTGATLNVPASGDAAAGELVKGNDTRLTDSRAPNGSAGGDLTGSYPNPTLNSSGVTGGTYGNGTQIPVFTVNAKGVITGASNLTITEAPPGGAAGGDLAGTYPNPTIKSDSVTLTTDTVGNYVATITGANGISITDGVGEGSATVVSASQNISTAGTPTFAGLTLSGALSGTTGTFSGSLTVGGLTLPTGVSGSDGVNHIHVAPNDEAATDTRTGLTAYDVNRPFATLAAALAVANAGDTIVLHPSTSAYGTFAMADLNLHLMPGAVVGAAVVISNTVTDPVYITGEGVIDSSGDGIIINGSNSVVHIHVNVAAVGLALTATAGEVHVRGATLISTTAAQDVISMSGSATLIMEGGASVQNPISGALAFDSISTAGTNTVAFRGVNALGGPIAGSPTIVQRDGTYYYNALGTTAGAGLLALPGVTPAADKVIYFPTSTTMSTFTVTSAARGVLDEATVALMRTAMGAAGLSDNNTFTGSNIFNEDLMVNEVEIGLGISNIPSNLRVGPQGPLGGALSGAISNTAIGSGTLSSVTGSDYSTALGAEAGHAADSLGGTYLGASAGEFVTSGTRNTFAGYEAGRWQSDGTTQLDLTGNDNTFLGSDTRGASANTLTNAIVIGKGAIATGNNSTVVGTDATLTSAIYGAPSGGGIRAVRISGSNFTTTLGTNTDTALSFSAAANTAYILDVQLTVVFPAAGTKLQVTAPAGATVEGYSVSTTVNTRFTAINTLSAATVGTAATTASVKLRVTVETSATAGTIAIGAASVTGGQTTTINTGSSMMVFQVQ